MKTHKPFSITILAFILLPAGPTVFAAPAAVPSPVIAYHTLPTATPVMTDDNSHDKVIARIRALVPGLGRRAAIPDAKDDWEKWHTQWKRQQEERRCNLWDVCVRVYKPGE